MGHRGVHGLEESDVIVGHEHVDKAAEAALSVEDALCETRVDGLQCGQHLTHRGAIDRHLGLTSGEGAKGGGHADGDAHRGGSSGGGVNGTIVVNLGAPPVIPEHRSA